MRPLINGYRNAHDEAADDGLIEAERRQGEQGDANGVWLGKTTKGGVCIEELQKLCGE